MGDDKTKTTLGLMNELMREPGDGARLFALFIRALTPATVPLPPAPPTGTPTTREAIREQQRYLERLDQAYLMRDTLNGLADTLAGVAGDKNKRDSLAQHLEAEAQRRRASNDEKAAEVFDMIAGFLRSPRSH